MFYYLIICLLFFVYGGFAINTVSNLDLEKYQGRWYQVYGDKFDQLFQHYGKCVTADYTLIPNGNISVLNSQYSLTNELEQYSGYAYYKSIVNSKLFPGELTVHLNGVPQDAPYYIISLGPEFSGLYDWSIVSDPIKLSLFVLTRDVNRFYSEYDTEVTELLNMYGFENVIKISQNFCRYIDFPKVKSILENNVQTEYNNFKVKY